MTKVTEKKTTDAVVEVKADAPAEVKVEKVDAPVIIPSPRSKKLAALAAGHGTTPEVLETIKVNLETISKLELDQLKETTLKSYFNVAWGKDKDAPASAEVTLNGEKLEPILKGVKTNMALLTGRSLYSHLLRDNRLWNQAHDTPQVVDIYIYKIKLANEPFRPVIEELRALEKKLEPQYMYQLLLVGAGSKITLTDELRAPSPWGKAYDFYRSGLGKATIINSELTDAVFFGDSLIIEAALNNVRVNDSTLVGAEHRQLSVGNTYITDSLLEDVHQSNFGEKRNYVSDSVIKHSTLRDVRFLNGSANIEKSDVRRCMFSAEYNTVKESRLTGLNFNTKDRVTVFNTVSHYNEIVTVRTSDSIQLDSIYDLTVVNVTGDAQVVMVRGQNNFWLNLWTPDGFLSPIELGDKRKDNEERDGFRFRGFHDHCENHMGRIRGPVSKLVYGALGRSEVVENIINSTCRTLEDRIGIANSMQSLKKLQRSCMDTPFY